MRSLVAMRWFAPSTARSARAPVATSPRGGPLRYSYGKQDVGRARVECRGARSLCLTFPGKMPRHVCAVHITWQNLGTDRRIRIGGQQSGRLRSRLPSPWSPLLSPLHGHVARCFLNFMRPPRFANSLLWFFSTIRDGRTSAEVFGPHIWAKI